MIFVETFIILILKLVCLSYNVSHYLYVLPWQKECEDLGKTVDNLKVENSELKKKLHSLSEELQQLTNENDSILVYHLKP